MTFSSFRGLRRHCNVFAARQALDRQRFETGHFRLLGHPQQRAEIPVTLPYLRVAEFGRLMNAFRDSGSEMMTVVMGGAAGVWVLSQLIAELLSVVIR